MSRMPIDGIISLVTLIINSITSIVTSIFASKKPAPAPEAQKPPVVTPKS